MAGDEADTDSVPYDMISVYRPVTFPSYFAKVGADTRGIYFPPSGLVRRGMPAGC